MDELLKGMSVYSDENPKTEHFFRSQRGEEETAEKTEGATREIGELKEVPEVKSSFIKQNYEQCWSFSKGKICICLGCTSFHSLSSKDITTPTLTNL